MKPRARGGTDDARNLRVVCRTHNQMYAEKEFGKDYVAARIEERRTQAESRKELSATCESLPDRK